LVNNGRRRSFGEIIHDARSDADLTQQQLADRLGVRQSTVSAWEKEVARPKTAVLVALADELGLDLHTITVAAAKPIPVTADRA